MARYYDMFSLALDENNNLKVEREIELVDDVAAIRQDILTNLRLHQGEYPFNNSKGINYMGYLQKPYLQNFLLSQITATILKDSRVNNVDLDVSKQNKKLEIKINTTIDNKDVIIELD